MKAKAAKRRNQNERRQKLIRLWKRNGDSIEKSRRYKKRIGHSFHEGEEQQRQVIFGTHTRCLINVQAYVHEVLIGAFGVYADDKRKNSLWRKKTNLTRKGWWMRKRDEFEDGEHTKTTDWLTCITCWLAIRLADLADWLACWPTDRQDKTRQWTVFEFMRRADRQEKTWERNASSFPG